MHGFMNFNLRRPNRSVVRWGGICGIIRIIKRIDESEFIVTVCPFLEAPLHEVVASLQDVIPPYLGRSRAILPA